MPDNILAPTLRETDDAEQGGPTDDTAEAKESKPRNRRAIVPKGADKSDNGAKLHLKPDVRFRLRMLAYQQDKSLSTVANEVLDKGLPKYNPGRTD
jgi:hypothetical protein